MTDSYAALAEYGSLFTAARPRALPELPPDVLDGVRMAVELGGGTGADTVVLAERLAPARLWTVESSSAMRAVLHATLARNPAVADLVTVEPGDVFTTPPAAGWDLLIGVHFVCQLRAGRRRDLWRLIAERLTDGGAAVLDRHYGPTTDAPVARRLSQTVVLGANEYERWFELDRVAAGHARSRVVYRTLRAGRVIAEAVTVTDMDVTSETEVMDETAAAGLVATVTDDWLVLRRR